MKVVKRDIEIVRCAIDIFDTNLGGGDENPETPKVLSDLKKLLARMVKEKPKT
jgi:hypothetical protein